MHRRHIIFSIAALLAVVLISIPAYAKSDIAGNWKLVADKSDYGPMPLPEKYEQTIEENGADIKVSISSVSAQGEYKADMNYNTEGKETTNDIRGNAMKCKAKWDGDVLVIESKLDFQGNEVTINDKWSVSDGGKTLVINRKLNTPQGELEQKIVMSKQ